MAEEEEPSPPTSERTYSCLCYNLTFKAIPKSLINNNNNNVGYDDDEADTNGNGNRDRNRVVIVKKKNDQGGGDPFFAVRHAFLMERRVLPPSQSSSSLSSLPSSNSNNTTRAKSTAKVRCLNCGIHVFEENEDAEQQLQQQNRGEETREVLISSDCLIDTPPNPSHLSPTFGIIIDDPRFPPPHLSPPPPIPPVAPASVPPIGTTPITITTPTTIPSAASTAPTSILSSPSLLNNNNNNNSTNSSFIFPPSTTSSNIGTGVASGETTLVNNTPSSSVVSPHITASSSTTTTATNKATTAGTKGVDASTKATTSAVTSPKNPKPSPLSNPSLSSSTTTTPSTSSASSKPPVTPTHHRSSHSISTAPPTRPRPPNHTHNSGHHHSMSSLASIGSPFFSSMGSSVAGGGGTGGGGSFSTTTTTTTTPTTSFSLSSPSLSSDPNQHHNTSHTSTTNSSASTQVTNILETYIREKKRQCEIERERIRWEFERLEEIARREGEVLLARAGIRKGFFSPQLTDNGTLASPVAPTTPGTGGGPTSPGFVKNATMGITPISPTTTTPGHNNESRISITMDENNSGNSFPPPSSPFALPNSNKGNGDDDNDEGDRLTADVDTPTFGRSPSQRLNSNLKNKDLLSRNGKENRNNNNNNNNNEDEGSSSESVQDDVEKIVGPLPSSSSLKKKGMATSTTVATSPFVNSGVVGSFVINSSPHLQPHHSQSQHQSIHSLSKHHHPYEQDTDTTVSEQLLSKRNGRDRDHDQDSLDQEISRAISLTHTQSNQPLVGSPQPDYHAPISASPSPTSGSRRVAGSAMAQTHTIGSSGMEKDDSSSSKSSSSRKSSRKVTFAEPETETERRARKREWDVSTAMRKDVNGSVENLDWVPDGNEDEDDAFFALDEEQIDALPEDDDGVSDETDESLDEGGGGPTSGSLNNPNAFAETHFLSRSFAGMGLRGASSGLTFDKSSTLGGGGGGGLARSLGTVPRYGLISSSLRNQTRRGSSGSGSRSRNVEYFEDYVEGEDTEPPYDPTSSTCAGFVGSVPIPIPGPQPSLDARNTNKIVPQKPPLTTNNNNNNNNSSNPATQTASSPQPIRISPESSSKNKSSEQQPLVFARSIPNPSAWSGPSSLSAALARSERSLTSR